MCSQLAEFGMNWIHFTKLSKNQVRRWETQIFANFKKVNNADIFRYKYLRMYEYESDNACIYVCTCTFGSYLLIKFKSRKVSYDDGFCEILLSSFGKSRQFYYKTLDSLYRAVQRILLPSQITSHPSLVAH